MSDPTRTPITDALMYRLITQVEQSKDFAGVLRKVIDELGRHAQQQETELQAATDRAESAERDAGRWRFVRDFGCIEITLYKIVDLSDRNIDHRYGNNAAIDAVMPKPASTTQHPDPTRIAGIPASADE